MLLYSALSLGFELVLVLVTTADFVEEVLRLPESVLEEDRGTVRLGRIDSEGVRISDLVAVQASAPPSECFP